MDLNGNTLDMTSKVLVVNNGKTLTIKDSSEEKTGKIVGTGTYVIQVASGGTLVIDDGIIQQNGTAYYALANLGNVVMNGGKILHTSYDVINKGTFELNGGIVESPITPLANTGKLIINGGLIHSTGEDANAVQTAAENASVEMNGGKIQVDGKGSCVSLGKQNTSFIMNDGLLEATYKNENSGGAGVMLFKDTEATINGGTINSGSFAVGTNGSVESENNTSIRAKVTINGGNINSKSTAVYIPQIDGVNLITGGTITGEASAVEIRAGELTITGGTLSGNLEDFQFSENTNGSSTIGSAVSVIQHNTKQPISVIITGGTFNGNVPFSEANTIGNNAEDVAKIAYDISGGVFNSTGDKTVDVENYDQGKFISGGKYTHWVTEYVQDRYGEKPEDNMIAVYKWRNVTLNKSKGDNATITRKKTISDDGVTIETEDDVTSETSVRALYNDEIVVNEGDSETRVIIGLNAKDAHDNVVASNDAKVNIPDDDVNVFIKYLKLDAEEIDPTKSVDETDMGIESSEETKREMLKSLKQDNELFNKALNTENPILELVVNPIELTEEDKSKVLGKITEGSEILGQFEIFVVLKDKAGNELGRIYDLTDDIDILLQVPDEIAVSNRRKGAEYDVVRNDSALDLIDSKVENNGYSVAFKTSKLSKYVLAYNLDSETIAPDDTLPNTGEDINEGKEKHKSIFDNPTTGDSVAIFIGIFVIAYIAYNKIRKRRVSKLYNRYHGRK